MNTDPLELPATAYQLRQFAYSGMVKIPALKRALVLIKHFPDHTGWMRFVDLTLLLLGAALMLAGVVFFFAYNWAGLPSLLKFGIIQAALIALIATTLFYGLERIQGKVALLGASIMVGVLLAVYGQVYQTGADPFQLFLLWAALIAGWVAVSRFTPLWLVLLVLLNLSTGLFIGQRVALSNTSIMLYGPLFLLNALWLFGWEYLRWRGIGWMQGRWLPRLAALAAFTALSQPTQEAITMNLPGIPWWSNALAPFVFAGFCGLIIWFYRFIVNDLLILTICALSVIGVLTTLISQQFQPGFSSSGSIPVGLFVLIQTAIAVALLRRTAQAWESRS